MEQHLIKGLHAEYKPAPWSGTNESGIRVVGPHVLILCDECSEVTSGEAGRALLAEAGLQPVADAPQAGTSLPLDLIEKMNLASEQGVIASVGGSAFSIYEDGRVWAERDRPQIGDRVYFEKYAGRIAPGQDGKRYRIMDYRCIAAIYGSAQAEAA